MSYRLKSGEKLADGLQRIFREEIGSALKETRRSPRHRGKAVHDFRKHLKKLRAAFSLAAAVAGKDRHRLEDRTVRQVAKVVSDVRDAHVRWQTVIQIRKQLHNGVFGKVFRRIEELLALEAESFAASAAGWEKRVVRRLETVRKRVGKWPLQDLSWKEICAAVADSYRRGRNRLADALKKPNPENFHRWRKEVKDLWYQLRILAPVNRIVLEEIARDAKTLADLLGQQHDFAFLRSRLKVERKDKSMGKERMKLEKLIAKRNKKLERDATELGRHFYAEAPKAFAKRISIFTQDWAC